MKVSIKRDRGMLKVDIDGRLYPPLSFKSFRPNPTNISEFYRAGVRLFSVLSSGIICALGVPYSRFGESWIGEGRYDFSAIDRQMDMFMENAPPRERCPFACVAMGGIPIGSRESASKQGTVRSTFLCASCAPIC